MDEESALSAALFIRIGYDLRAGYCGYGMLV